MKTKSSIAYAKCMLKKFRKEREKLAEAYEGVKKAAVDFPIKHWDVISETFLDRLCDLDKKIKTKERYLAESCPRRTNK